MYIHSDTGSCVLDIFLSVADASKCLVIESLLQVQLFYMMQLIPMNTYIQFDCANQGMGLAPK